MTSKRILCIDGDDAFVRDLGEAAQRGGFDWAATASSNDGFERARAERPDLIIVNVEIAPTNGWSICTKLKKDDELRGIPIVLTSSTSTPDTFEKHRKLKTRADEYILKPFAATDLLRTARSLLGMPPEEEPAADAPIDEELVIDDESLSLAEFDAAGAEEAIEVPEDEPLGDYDALGEDAAFDPLGAGDENTLVEDPLAADALGDDTFGTGAVTEESLGPDAFADEAAAGAAADEFGGEAFTDEPFEAGPIAEDPLAGTPFGDGSALALDQDPLDADALSADALDDGSLPAEPFEGEPFDADGSADDALSIEPLAADPLAGELDPAALDGDDASLEAFGDGEAFTDGAQDELAAGADATAGEELEEFAADPLAGEYDAGSEAIGGVDELDRVAGLEARVAELETELEGSRQADADRGAELERLRAEVTRRDRELRDLRDGLRQKEAELDERREAESTLNLEVGRLRDEKGRRDVTEKSLKARADQLLLQGKKLERELAAAREEAKSAAALKAKIAELEQEVAQGRDAAVELEVLREQVASAQAEVTTAQAELSAARVELATAQGALAEARQAAEVQQAANDETEQARAAAESRVDEAKKEAEALRQDLDEARKTAEKALANAVTLQEKLSEADERARSVGDQATQLEASAQAAREALMRALESLGPN